MFTGIITAAWRGFGFDHGIGFIEIRLGFLSLGLCKGTLWQQLNNLDKAQTLLVKENEQLRKQLNGNHEKT